MDILKEIKANLKNEAVIDHRVSNIMKREKVNTNLKKLIICPIDKSVKKEVLEIKQKDPTNKKNRYSIGFKFELHGGIFFKS